MDFAVTNVLAHIRRRADYHSNSSRVSMPHVTGWDLGPAVALSKQPTDGRMAMRAARDESDGCGG